MAEKKLAEKEHAQIKADMVAKAEKKDGPAVPRLTLPDSLQIAGDEEEGTRPADQFLPATLKEMVNPQQNVAEVEGALMRVRRRMEMGIFQSNLPVVELEEMGAKTSKATEGECQTLVPAGDMEMGSYRSNPPVTDGASSTSTAAARKESKLDFDLKVSVSFITVSMIPLIDMLFLHGPTAKLNLTLKLSAFFAFTAFISAICLMFNTLKLMSIYPPAPLIPKNQLRVSKILFTTATASLFLTCISITYSLLPKAYYFLPLALLPSLLVGGFHFLYGADTGNGEISPAQIKALKKELKRATQLTLSLVSTSFSGFIGVLLAIYHKAASLGAAYSYVKVSVHLLLLGGGIAGAFALLLCRMLSSNAVGTTWQRVILAAANVVMIAMIVPAVLMIAETILHGLLVAGAVLFPVLTGAAAWLLVEFCTTAAGSNGRSTGTDDGNKAAQGTMYATAVAVASVSFGAILAIFAGMLGGAVGKEQLKACTFLLTSAFVAAVSLGVVVMSGMARAEKTKASTDFAATVLTCYGLGTLVLSALALFYQVGA